MAACLCVAQNIDTQIWGSRWPAFGTDSGAANAYVVTTVAPLGHSLRTGSMIQFVALHANTGASTVNVDGAGAIAIKKMGSLALVSGDIIAGAMVTAIYDGTNFQMQGTSISGATANGAVYATGSTTGTSTSAMTDGQLLIGDSTGAPQAATITAGTNVTVTNGHHAITISASNGLNSAWPKPNSGWTTNIEATCGGSNTSWGDAWGGFSGTFFNTAATTTGVPCVRGTQATVGTNAFLSTSATSYRYGNSSEFQVSYTISTTANIRMMICGSDQAAATQLNSDVPAGNWVCFRYSTAAGDTNFMAGTSASGTGSFASTGIAADTGFHKFDITMTSTSAVFSIDGVVTNTISTNIPAAATMLAFMSGVHSIAGTLSGSFGWMWLQMNY